MILAMTTMGLLVYQISNIVEEIKIEQRDLYGRRFLEEKEKKNQSNTKQIINKS